MSKKSASEGMSEEMLKSENTGRGFSWKRALSSGTMGLIIGGLAAWALSNIGGSAIVFIVVAIASGYYLYQKPLPSAAIGTGLYISAGLLVLTPILFYVPVIFGPAGDSGAEEAGAFIGGILGLLIWGFVFFLVALVVFVLGYFVNRRAKNKLESIEEMAATESA